MSNFVPPLVDFNDLPDAMLSGITNQQYCEMAHLQQHNRSETATSRFVDPVSNEQLIDLIDKATPEKTRQRNNWAEKILISWKKTRILANE